ncbi:MAG: GerAB/ArcD/ProY family transporter [Oscillospiraceae bacterium]|jgi:spore germination protein KB|nr:GerAB/ArcD/ProY family transporter [Oscillospiraceae bacterium]
MAAGPAGKAVGSEHISPAQWTYATCCFLMGTILRSGFINSLLDNESWMTALTGAVVFLPFMAIYLSLVKRYPGKSMFEIADAALGKVGGTIANLMLCVFYTMLAMVNLMEVGAFVTGYLIQGTLFLSVTLAAALTAAYILIKGVGALSRMIPTITVLAGITLLTNWVQAIPAMDFAKLLPMFNKPLGSYVHATLFAVAVPFCESMTMFALLPMVGANKYGEIKKSAVKVFVFTFVVMVLVHLRETATLGSLLIYTAIPTYEVMRMIDTGSTFARTESVFAIQLMMLSLIKVTIILYALTRCLSHVTGIEHGGSDGPGHKAIALPVCVFVAVYAATFRDTAFNNIEWFVNVAPIVWLAFEAGIPAVILAAAALRGRSRGKAAAV